jgi:hypothetical protein
MSTAKPIRFTEHETGTEVLVVFPFAWDPFPQQAVVTYPSGRTYTLPEEHLRKHFTIVSPQEVFIDAYGGIDERPTPTQWKVSRMRKHKKVGG